MDAGDLGQAKLASALSAWSYVQSRRVSEGNADFLHELDQQFHVPPEQALAAVTTPSLEALQLYSRAASLMAGDAWRPAVQERQRMDAARELLRQATSVDPQFASAWLLLAPLIAWAVAFVVAPALIMLIYSFGQRGSLGGVSFTRLTLENYAGVFDPVYLRILIRSVVYAAITTVLCLAAGYPVGYLIGRADAKWRNLLLMGVMVPFWTSFLIRTYAWVTILKSEGLLNSLLLQLHLIAAPLEMLAPTLMGVASTSAGDDSRSCHALAGDAGSS